jgi:hypothetical protein
VPGQDDVRVGGGGRRRPGRHRGDPPGIGQHRDQGGLDPGRVEVGVVDPQCPAGRDGRLGVVPLLPPRSGSGTYAAGRPKAASSAHVIAPERQIAKSAAA